MIQIFISYRREDSPDAAGRIYDRLKSHFGEKQIFFDIDSIPPGIDFRKHITEFVSKCDILVVIIGERWFATDSRGVSRLEDPSDFVRIEIETALKRGIPVIPVPVGRAKHPAEQELPSDIKDLHYRNAYEVRSGTSFEGHIRRLIKGIENSIIGVVNDDIFGEVKAGKEKNVKERMFSRWKVVLGIVIISIASFVVWSLNQEGKATTTVKEAISDVHQAAEVAKDDVTNMESPPLKRLYIQTSQGSPSVAVGEKASIYVTVKGNNNMVIEDATVLISSGGGKFL
ncbi:MAG TPA: toll/interleukin-1 receptor domain-containing protein, partial [Eudoraea sp.]|nr:toll/interleukin-1 receptor domain-containing protein [Eudoraea sp.]